MLPKHSFLLTLNILLISYLVFKHFQVPQDPPVHSYEPETSEITLIQEETKNMSYSFDHPAMALHLLEKLDTASVIEEEALRKTYYEREADLYRLDFEYCNKHRVGFVENPQGMFESINFATSFPSIKFDWKADIFPRLGQEIPEPHKKKLWDFTTDVQIFFMRSLFHYKRQIGKQFSCLTQASNHIPGHDLIYRKDNASQALVAYAQKFETRPQCFNFNKFFPKTWVLTDKYQCRNFFKEFLSEKYQALKQERAVVYFRKIGANAHQGSGVFPMNDPEEDYIKNLYENGRLCGRVKENNLIQYNIHNLLLVNARKFGFRSFMLIASVNPLIAYYHDGYARLSLDTYDTRSNQTTNFITNVHLNMHHDEYKDWTRDQIEEYTYMSMEKFTKYMLDNKLVSDPEWLENHLRKEFMKVKIHLLRMGQSGFIKLSSVFELFGLDYIMDENLNLWFIEANTMPALHGKTRAHKDLFIELLYGTFDIVSGLLRSRAKRIISYVNSLTGEYGINVPDLEKRREEFNEISKNYFEPEFMPKSSHGFYKIMDENLEGVARYSGLLAEECLEF